MSAERLHVDPTEKRWIQVSIAVLAIFAIAIGLTGFVMGFQVPLPEQRVDPALITQEGPFAEPGLRELAPGKYEAYILAQIWSFVPNEIRVPAGSTVTFYVTSKDVQHGFHITGTNVNVQVLPGYVGKITHRFDKPGTYHILCNEYCGLGHQAMYGRVIVEP